MPGKFLNNEEKQKLREQKRKKKLVISTATRWTIGLVVATIILLNLFTYVLQIVRYNGSGMEPSLHSGQTLVLLKTQDVEQGDVIAFYYNNQVLVRRVIAQDITQISIETDGDVLINSSVLDEPYVTEPSVGQCNLTFPYYLQNGYVFVMGDNRPVAMDSRLSEIGPVLKERIIGKVILSL